MDKLVYIVILNYRNWTDVKDCISSIVVSTYRNFRIVVLDNPSGDNSINELKNWISREDILNKLTGEQNNVLRVIDEENLDAGLVAGFGKITLIQNKKNEGFAAGNNVILQYLMNEDAYIWLLNPDMTVAPEAMAAFVSCAESQSVRSITGGVLKKHDKPAEIYLYGGGRINWRTATISFIKDPKDIDKIDYLNGSCIFVHASHFKTLGLLPTKYFLYWEETAWCYNAKQTGYKINVCLEAVCYDKISATIGKSYLSDFYYTRNGLLFIKEYSKSNLKYAKIATLLRVVRRLASGEFDRAKGTISGLMAFHKMQQNEA